MVQLGVVSGQPAPPQRPITVIDDDLLDEHLPPPTKRQYTQPRIREPEIKTSRSPRDAAADIDRGLKHLSDMDDDLPMVDTADILDYDVNHGSPPNIAPPPIPSEPPPDFDPMEAMKVFDSSPPRDSRALRAAGRTKNHPGIESIVQPSIAFNAEVEPSYHEHTDIPPALRVSQTPGRTEMTRQPSTPKPGPPPTLPKPKMTGTGAGRRQQGGAIRPGLLATPLSRSRESLAEDENVGVTPRGYVRATASAINQGEIDALGEKINFLEKQLKVLLPLFP